MEKDTKVSLATNDTLKCSACGNKKFTIKKKDKQIDGKMMDCWIAVCEDCGYVMKFHKPIAMKDSMF